jgi:hypothetical protein
MRLELATEKVKELESSCQLGRIDNAIVKEEQRYRQLYEETLQELE